MSTTNIYLIRHGESQGNKRQVFLGHVDLDLTETGHLQAELTAEFLKDIPVDAIYSSDLLRAYHTAQHTAEKVGLPIVTSQNLREIFAGEWENKTFAELKERFAQSYGTWCQNIGCAACDKGESVADLQKRIVGEVEKIALENEGKTVFVFTHATPVRVTKAAFDGISLDDMKNIPWASNASVTHLQCVDGKFSVLEYGMDHFMGNAATVFPRGVC